MKRLIILFIIFYLPQNILFGQNKGQAAGFGYELSGRKLIQEPVIDNKFGVDGKITVAIQVDGSGDVLSADVIAPTTISNTDVIQSTIEKAKNVKFDTDYSQTSNQSGKLIFLFIINQKESTKDYSTENRLEEFTDGGINGFRDGKIYDFAEISPEFPGGTDSLRKVVQRLYKIPRSYKNSKQKGGTIVTRFVVMKDGSIGHIEILKGISHKCDYERYPNCKQDNLDSITSLVNKEAIRAIKAIPTKFSPGMQAGKAVRVRFTLPIVIKIK